MMSIRSWLGAAVVLVAMASVSEAAVFFRGDFETGKLDQWRLRNNVHRISVVTSPVREGKYAGRFEIRPGDTGPAGIERVELNYSQPSAATFENAEVYYAWSVMVDPNQPITRGLHQIMFWEAFGVSRQMIALNLSDENVSFRVVGRTLWMGKMPPGRWHDFVMHVKWSPDPAISFVEFWYDGQQVVPKTMIQTMFKDATKTYANYCDIGVVRGDNTATEVVYFDRVLAATTLADVLTDAPPARDGGLADVVPAGDAGRTRDGSAASDGSDAANAMAPVDPDLDGELDTGGTRRGSGGCIYAAGGPTSGAALVLAAMFTLRLARRRRR